MFDNDDDEARGGKGRKLRKCRRIFAVLCFFREGKEEELKEASVESFNIADLFQER
jgi:hypothetical protein